MKCHAIFVIFEKEAKFEMCLLQILGGALWVNNILTKATYKVIWGTGQCLKSHLIGCRSRGSNPNRWLMRGLSISLQWLNIFTSFIDLRPLQFLEYVSSETQ